MYRLCEGLRAHGEFEPFAALPREEPYWDRFVALLGEDHCLEIPHRKFSLGALLRLIRFARKQGIRIVHSHGKGAATLTRPMVLASLGGMRGVHTAHGVHIGTYGPLAMLLYRAYENATARLGCHALIYVSESEKAKAMAVGLWRGLEHRVIPNGVLPGVDLSAMSATDRAAWVLARRGELGLPAQAFLVATISRFDVQKNMACAFAIAERLPQLTFVWIGDGEERPALEHKAKDAGLANIVCTGFQPQASAYLPACDAYLSTSRWEGLPLAVLEAMANGLPIVASDVTGNRDILSLSDRLYAFPLENPGLAVEHLLRLAQDRSTHESAREASLQLHARHFSLQVMLKQTEAVYGLVAGRTGA